MKKHYGQMINTLTRLALFAAVVSVGVGIALFFDKNYLMSVILVFVGTVILINTVILARKRIRDGKEYIKILSGEKQIASGNVLRNFPLPICVLHIDGTILWFNDKMCEAFGENDLYGVNLEGLMPNLRWGSVLKSGSVCRTVERMDKTYLVVGEIINTPSGSTDEMDKKSVYLYFIDKTDEEELRKKYIEERTDVALITIDNYDYLVQKSEDSEGQAILFKINQFVSAWVKESNGVLKKTDRDKYFACFAHKHLDSYIDKKFELLTRVRELSDEVHLPVSISMGVGTGGNISENEVSARTALELVLGRGGDQVAVKDETQYKFYCSKTKEYEKSTKVKTRAVAIAIKDFIKNVDNVVIMGHSSADYDSFGAQMGLQHAVRALGKKPYLVCDNMGAVIKLYNKVRDVAEYKDILIAPEHAGEILRRNSMLIIVDTHRPSLLPNPELLNLTDKIILIDHHRRSTDFINPCSLTYHEPYASSTCEMVTELLQYISVGETLSELEAQCLYMGILMDTKNFILKTGVRTFEAASYLRRHGLNTVAVKQLFSVDKADYDLRAGIVHSTELVADCIGVAMLYEHHPNLRVIASQAADDMLNIEKIVASFVIYPIDNTVGISGRSLGDINVQVILEELGGGGHLTVAGAQIKGKSMGDVKKALIEAINKYFSNNS